MRNFWTPPHSSWRPFCLAAVFFISLSPPSPYHPYSHTIRNRKKVFRFLEVTYILPIKWTKNKQTSKQPTGEYLYFSKCYIYEIVLTCSHMLITVLHTLINFLSYSQMTFFKYPLSVLIISKHSRFTEKVESLDWNSLNAHYSIHSLRHTNGGITELGELYRFLGNLHFTTKGPAQETISSRDFGE